MLWISSAASAVDLHPTKLSEFDSSFARGTNGMQQVGYARDFRDFYSVTHAMVWSGTSDSAVDLHPLLPPGAFLSEAYEIDASGIIYGIATNGFTDYYAVMWVPVPEPAMLPLAISACLAGAVTRRRKAPLANATHHA